MTAPAPTPSDPGRVLGFTLRGGLATSPEYFGSDEYEIGPDLGFALDRLRFGPFDIEELQAYYAESAEAQQHARSTAFVPHGR